MSAIVIIDYGLSNLKSVKRAFEYCGEEVLITKNRSEIRSASKLVLPGVGAFEDGMKGLLKLELVELIKERAKAGVPLLGICLGMQMLLDESDENGLHAGLGLIKGRVEKIPECDENGIFQPVPHISWRKLINSNDQEKFIHPLFNSNLEGKEAYFIHSYQAKCAEQDECIAVVRYGGREISAIIARDNIIGTQFHPEKSGKVGLEILKLFIDFNLR